ncbi:class I SAM-dependent methyltransferase family protein, partial [Intestinirhabdus alba]
LSHGNGRIYRAAHHDAGAITLPTQLLVSGEDYVVHRQPQLEFYQRLRSPLKELHVLPGFYHDTLGEKERQLAFDKMRGFIDTLYGQPPRRFDYAHEDRWSPGADSWRLLNGGPAPFSLDDLGYRALRYGMKALGTQSTGVRLGFETGFDSGSTLDYVYRNQPQGSSALGRLIDKNYLNSVGWKGIRQRKVHLQTLIQQAVVRLTQQGTPVRVVDIAAGHGRYVLDALEGDAAVETILLRDYSELNVTKGQEMIASRGMADRARFERGDAFNRGELASLTPNPTLGIVSGLYELFPDNGPVRDSLAGLAEAIAPGGVLIYTGQPWHPQLKTIAWSLTSHKDGKAWVMRVRTQGEMDALVREAGFDKCAQLIDEWGIFTVSLAVRRAS